LSQRRRGGGVGITVKEHNVSTVENANLTLKTIDDTVTIIVDFDGRFSPFERELAALGMTYHSHVDVVGVDNGTDIGPAIVSFDHEPFEVTKGSGDQVIHQTLKLKVDRSTLQEDPDAGNADELKAKIRIHAPQTPVAFTDDVFTDQEVLLG
jgi:hypothetical protein